MKNFDALGAAGSGDPRRGDRITSSVLELLGNAEGELDRDTAAARHLIMRARALLEVAAEPAASGIASGGFRPWQIRRIENFVRAQLPDTIRVSDLGSEVRMSPSHFSRIFKKSFGETPQAYVRRQRLERACHLMLVTTQPLTEIALACGYTDHAHFCRHFRAAFARSPATWRREQGALAIPRAITPNSGGPGLSGFRTNRRASGAGRETRV